MAEAFRSLPAETFHAVSTALEDQAVNELDNILVNQRQETQNVRSLRRPGA